LSEYCGLKGLTVSAENIVNGEPLSQLLGFCWMLLRTYQGVVVDAAKGQSFEQGLLSWLKTKLAGYSDINLDDGFKSESFVNGKTMLALINEFDNSLLDYGSYKPGDKLKNCTDGLKIGEEKANVPALMEAGELSSGKVSEKNPLCFTTLCGSTPSRIATRVSRRSRSLRKSRSSRSGFVSLWLRMRLSAMASTLSKSPLKS
jgi:hypothetical protein